MTTFTVITVGIIYWVAIWGLLSHIVDFMTRGNIVKEILVYFAMLVFVYIYSMKNPKLLNHL